MLISTCRMSSISKVIGCCIDFFLSAPRPHGQAAAAAVLYSCRPLLQLYTVFQLCACHSLTSNMTVTERFATSRYYCLMPVHARVGLTLTKMHCADPGNRCAYDTSNTGFEQCSSNVRYLLYQIIDLVGALRFFGAAARCQNYCTAPRNATLF